MEIRRHRIGYDKLEITDEAKVSQTKADPSRSTGAEVIALGQQRIRDSIQRGEVALGVALEALEAAESAFHHALTLAGNSRPREVDPFPQVNPSAVAAAKAARSRRQARGEDVA